LAETIGLTTLSNAVDTLIVTPTLGDRDSLRRTLESVAQIGGSRVKHMLICPAGKRSEIQDRYPRIEVIPEPEKSGIFGAVNYALKLHGGSFKYVGYINDDDYWLPDFVRLVEALDADPGAAVAYGRVRFVDTDNGALFDSTSSSRYRNFKALLAHRVVLITQQATLIRHDVFERLRGFDVRYRLTADTEFWVRCVEQGLSMRYVPNVCAAYMIQPGQLSSNVDQSSSEIQRIYEEHCISKDLRSWLEFSLFRLANTPRYLQRVFRGKAHSVDSLLET
jgi:GT2 family glycosyltransferase